MNFLPKCAVLTCIVLFSMAPALARNVPARGWEGTIDLPTYLLAEEDPFPPFGIVNTHHVYPYTMLDDLTDRRENKKYRALFLENEYLKATVLPDLGGRLYSLYDKVSRREVFYRNQVVKYGLVALRGAWISGGVEFNFPNGHTVVTVSPVDGKLLQNADGSARAIVGGMDRITGMHWEVALILRPGESRLEQQVTLFNNTEKDNLYWYWANAAVPATADMQFIYPMREANPHSATEIWTYPVWKGVDYSWYKNIPQPTSLFGLGIRRDFFGAYYHKTDYGVVHAADYRDVPGKKIWSWGVADDGLIWTDLLTDQDGPYNEIQSGRFETQLYREFLPAQRVQTWKEYWYPVKGLAGGFVEANQDLALNLAATGSQTKLLLHSNVSDAGAALRVKRDGRLVREVKPVRLRPGETVSYDLDVAPSGRDHLEIVITSSQGLDLLRWSGADPVDGNREFQSRAGEHNVDARTADQMTIEELFLRGIQQEKEGSDEAALDTFRAVLERDEGNTPALLKLAWWNYAAADFKEAETLLNRALQRDSTDPALLYAAGVIRRAQGRLDAAEDSLWNDIRFGGDLGSSLLQLGEISIQKKNYPEAVTLLRRVVAQDSGNALAWADLSVAERLSGNSAEARRAAGQAFKIMPLLPHAAVLMAASPQDMHLNSILRTTENVLDAAGWLARLGDLDTSDRILHALANANPSSTSPMIYYYLASHAWKRHQETPAKEFAAKAVAAPIDKVFPQRASDAAVLQDAIAHDPRDGHAQYLLGTFLFAHGKYDAGAASWKRARDAGFEHAALERNLAIYAWRVKNDLPSAADHFQTAVRLSPGQYRLYPELDEVYAQLQQNEKRSELFSRAPRPVLEHDTVLVRRALLLVEERKYDDALQILMNHRFKPWEGGRIVRDMFVLANLEKGQQAMRDKQYAMAEQAFRRALEYPVNQGVGKPSRPVDTQVFYWLGESLSAQGKKSEAESAWRNAADSGEVPGSSDVFRALALQKLGNEQQATRILQNLSQVKTSGSAQDLYAAGLAARWRGQEQMAKTYFQQALSKDPGLWNARFALRGQ